MTTPPRPDASARHGSRNAILVLVAIVVVLLFASLGSDPSEPTPQGDPGVFAEIAASTDCTELQTGFDRNMDDAERREPGDPLRDVVLSYAEAYDSQMADVGCYG